MPDTKTQTGWKLESSYTTLSADFYTRIAPVPVKAQRLVIFNHALASTTEESQRSASIESARSQAV